MALTSDYVGGENFTTKNFSKKSSLHFHWMSVSIIFNSTPTGIHLCKIVQLQNFKTRIGGEIYSSDVNIHKDNCRVR